MNVKERDGLRASNAIADYLRRSLKNGMEMLDGYGVDGVSFDELVNGMAKFATLTLAEFTPDDHNFLEVIDWFQGIVNDITEAGRELMEREDGG